MRFGRSAERRAPLYPMPVAFNAVPKAAIAPILIVGFGIGIGPGILAAFLISFFPITVNIATGLASVVEKRTSHRAHPGSQTT
jgi:NitT/TauT family transport system permease protein